MARWLRCQLTYMWLRSVMPETVAGTATASRPTRAARSRNAHVAGAMAPTVAPVASHTNATAATTDRAITACTIIE